MKEGHQSLEASWLMPPYGSKQSHMKKIEVRPAIQINLAHVEAQPNVRAHPYLDIVDFRI